jgi:hypothetical protein
LLGKGTEDQSGRAIQAQQQGGLIELGDGLDLLRRLDHRVFKATWFAIRQYWQAPMWIRVTEDADAPQWIGLNQFDPMTGQMMNQIGMADVDIIIEDAPDVPTLEGETFAAVMDVLGKGAPPAVMKVMIELHPGLKASVKKKLTKYIEQQQQEASQAAQAQAAVEQAKTQGDLAAKDAKAKLDQQRLQFEMQTHGAGEQGKQALEAQKLQLEREQMALEAQQSSVENEIKRAELAIKMKELELKMRELEVRGAEMTQNAEIERERMSVEKSKPAEQPKPAPQPQDRNGEAVGKGLEALAAALSRPRTLVRGPDGRAAGIE